MTTAQLPPWMQGAGAPPAGAPAQQPAPAAPAAPPAAPPMGQTGAWQQPPNAPAQPMGQPAAPVGGDWAAQVANAEIVNGGGRYFEPGAFVCDLLEIKAFPSPQNGHQKWVAIFQVIESTHPGMQAGTQLSWAHNLTKDEYGYAASDIRLFYGTIMAAYGQDPRGDIDPNLMRRSTSEEQILRGTRFKIDAWEKPPGKNSTRTTGITKLNFEVLQPGTTLGLTPQQAPAASQWPTT